MSGVRKPSQRILHMTLVRRWFDEVARGAKREEYRDRTDYWKTRLEGRDYDIVRFRNGYAADAPEMDVEFLGLDKRRRCYAICLGKVLSIKRWPARQVWVIGETFVVEGYLGGMLLGELPQFDLGSYEVVARYSQKQLDSMMRAYHRKHGDWPGT
jgi:hypothetical protein